MVAGALDTILIPSLRLEEIASDGSTLSNPAADSRRLFLGEDGLLHLRDSAGTVTDIAGSAVTDATIATSDVTTNNASTTKHGWLKKLSNVSTEYMSGTGVFSTPAGGGMTRTQLGYTTIGGTAFAATAFRQYLKKITVSSAGLLAGVAVYCKANTNGVDLNIAAGLWDDSAGSPVHLIAAAQPNHILIERASNVKDGRWFYLPIGAEVTATSYWIGCSSATATLDFYKDGSGTDHYISGTNAHYLSDVGHASVGIDNITTDRWSMYAVVLS